MHILERKLNINSNSYLRLANIIKSAGGEIRLIGGVVRDALIGKNSSDIDMATDLLPENVINILKDQNIKVIPTGIKFGTVTALLKGEAFQITTLRKDISSDGRRAHVEFTNDFYTDAERRDFTINALSYCPFQHKIYDYFTGLKDLEMQRVIFIGKAEDRIREDYLRILRFFRFSCRYGKSIDKTGLLACESLRFGLKNLSGERIKSEMDRLLGEEKFLDTLQIMYEAKILQQILPIEYVNKDIIQIAEAFAQKLNVKLEISTLYALLFKDNKSLDKNMLHKLKFSRNEANDISSLIKFGQDLSEEDLQIELKRLWLEDQNYVQYFLLAAAYGQGEKEISTLYLRLKNLKKAIFPVTGTDILKKIAKTGPQTGEIIKHLKKIWIKADFSLSKQDLIGLIDDYTK